MRVPLFLRDHHVGFQVLLHAPAHTAQRRAKYLHVPGRHVAKCVLLSAPAGFVVAVLPATHRLDMDALGRNLGQPVRLAEESEIAQLFGDCQWGGLVPFGALYGLTTIVDEAFDPQGSLVFAAQRHGQAIRMRYADFARLEQPRRFRFALSVDPRPAPAHSPEPRSDSHMSRE
jgi:Ala-tRNA(Pro) deacylase